MHCDGNHLLQILPLLTDEELIRIIRRAEHTQQTEIIELLLKELERRRVEN